jgi:hypothetical protein
VTRTIHKRRRTRSVSGITAPVREIGLRLVEIKEVEITGNTFETVRV